MRLLLFTFTLISAFLLTACISVNLPRQEIKDTKTFILTPKVAQEKFAYRTDIVPFRSESPAKFKMLHRKGSELVPDEYNKWGLTPSLMMTGFFRSAFIADASDKNLTLRANILTFEANDDTAQVQLTISYSVSVSGDPEPFLTCVLKTSVPMKDLSANSFAEAMTEAATSQVRELKERILGKLNKK